MRSRISNIIKEYSEQGIHRSGTQVDNESAQWLSNKIREMGCNSMLHEIPFKQLVVQQAYIELNETRIPGLPLYDCTPTPKTGITGKLGGINTESTIGLYIQTPENMQNLIKARQSNRHQAILVVTNPDIPGLAPINASQYQEPYGPPVIQVSGEYSSFLKEQALQETMTRIVVSFTKKPSKAYKVFNIINGKKPELPPLFITTPRSGWYSCASERGGGIATYLEIHRAFAKETPCRNVFFIATTFHELGYYGLKHYLLNRGPNFKNPVAWIHLGASFAARDSMIGLQASDKNLMSLGENEFTSVGIAPNRVFPVGIRPRGEAEHIFDEGEEFLSIIASNPLFHSPLDLWPDSVDVEKAFKVTKAFLKIAKQLASEHN